MAKQATQEVLEFPSGGIADFYMEDHEIEALEAEEAEEEACEKGWQKACEGCETRKVRWL